MSYSTSEENFSELNNPLTSEVPTCFKGLEEHWADLTKDGRGWFYYHYS